MNYTNTLFEDMSSELNNIERVWLRRSFIVFSVIVCFIVGTIMIFGYSIISVFKLIHKDIKNEVSDLKHYCKITFTDYWNK